jgi:HPt (histidine-containing phosphotransfer) domain-containing protein
MIEMILTGQADERVTGIEMMHGQGKPDCGDSVGGPAIDHGQLDSIEEILSPSAFTNLIGTFLDGAATRIELVEQFAASGDLVGLARHAHDLVSTAGNFGAGEVSRLARRIETAARQQDAALVAELMPALHVSARHAFALIRARLDAIPA